MGYALSTIKMNNEEIPSDPIESDPIRKLEDEFRQTFRQAALITESLQMMPCRSNAIEVINNFKNHPSDSTMIVDCINLMRNYEDCLKIEMKDKIERYAYEIKPINRINWECL